MKKLVRCQKCSALISDTAICCPRCLKKTNVGMEEVIKSTAPDTAETAKSLGLFAVGVAVNAAAAATGGLLSLATMSSYNSSLKRAAKKAKAIDMFELGEEYVAFVSESEFNIAYQTWGDTTLHRPFHRSELKNVAITESKSKKGLLGRSNTTILKIEYTQIRRKKEKEVSEKYKFKGDDAQVAAEWALLKFKEYQI